jgi:hypothetical protein
MMGSVFGFRVTTHPTVSNGPTRRARRGAPLGAPRGRLAHAVNDAPAGGQVSDICQPFVVHWQLTLS